MSRTYNLSAYDAQVQVALELWGGRVMGLVAGERKLAKVLALRRKGAQAIERHLPPEQFEILKAAEESEREIIARLVGKKIARKRRRSRRWRG